MYRIAVMSSYLRIHAKHRRSGGRSAANSNAPSYIIAKIAHLCYLYVYSKHGRVIVWGVFQAELSSVRIRIFATQ